MEKGLDACLNPNFKNRLPTKEIGPFDMTNDDKKNQKAFLTMSLLSKVNLQKKADKNFPSGRVWKLWLELQGDFNPDNSIAETELELALIGGPVEKMSFFQIVHTTKVSTQIHSYISQYDVYKVSSKKWTIT
jgi:hypothetical protein